MISSVTVEDHYIELRHEIRELGLTMIRLELLIKEASKQRTRWHRKAELEKARDVVRDRRTALLHEVWLFQQGTPRTASERETRS